MTQWMTCKTCKRTVKENPMGICLSSHGGFSETPQEDAYISSGNIFADVGHPHPEEAKAKSDLAIQIYRVLKSRKITQEKGAEILEIDHSDLHDILRGKLSEYSIDVLRRFLGIINSSHELITKRSPK